MTQKRSYAEFAASTAAEPNLTVLTADGGRIPAHNDVLRLVCSCLRNAPASDTWDLSNLLVNGSPIRQSTVTAVLEVLYSNLGALDYKLAGKYSLAQLLDMLLFADAVGCSRAVLRQLAGMLGSCVPAELVVTFAPAANGSGAAAGAAESAGSAAAGQTVQLHLEETYGIRWPEVSSDSADESTAVAALDQSILCHLRERHSSDIRQLTQQQRDDLCLQLSAQLEQLLFVGFKLDLQQLLQPALRFLRVHAGELINDDAEEVFSQRVLAAASGASGAELLSRACLQLPLGRGFGIGSVFGSVKFTETEYEGDVAFNATLLQDFHQLRKGTVVAVQFGRRGRMTVTPAGVGASAGVHATFGVVVAPQALWLERNAKGIRL